MHPELMEKMYLKDLKKRNDSDTASIRTLIVDDSRHKVSRNYGNAIYIDPFEGDDTDTELEHLAKFVNWLHHEPNFRIIEKRGWRNRTYD